MWRADAARPARELPLPDRPVGEARDAADRILSRPEFRADDPTLLERAERWIGDRLEDLVESLAGTAGGTTLAVVVLGAVVVIALVLLARLVRSTRRDPREAPAPDTPSTPARSAAAWREEAARLEAAGEWREALRCRYRALVADLGATGVVEDVPGRTAGEHRRSVEAAAPVAAPDFDAASELFELAWFGRRPTGPAESERLARLSERVVEEVR